MTIHVGSQITLKPLEDSKIFTQMLTKAFDGFKSGDEVTLHFQGKRQMKTNKIALFFSSKLFQKIFETNCDCTTNPLQEYNILCPDFDPDSMAKVLQLINTGTTELSPDDVQLKTDMISIMKCLQIDINLESASNNKVQMLSQSMAEASDQIEMTAWKIAKTSDKVTTMTEKGEITLQKMTEENEITSQKMTEENDIQIESDNLAEEGNTPEVMTQNMTKMSDHGKKELEKMRVESGVLTMTSDVSEICAKIEMTSQKLAEICNKPVITSNNMAGASKKHMDILRIPEMSRSANFSRMILKTVDVNPSKLPMTHSCQVCGLKFYRFFGLQQHMKKHESATIEETDKQEMDDSLICPFCKDCFTTFDSYNAHVQTHSNDSSYNKRHIESFNGVPNDGDDSDYEADVTDKMEVIWSESSWQDLSNDTEQNHGSDASPSQYNCPLCLVGKNTYSHLLSHIASVHYKDEILQCYDSTQRKCQICNKTSKTYSHLVSHLAGTHKFLDQILPDTMVDMIRQIQAKKIKTERKFELDEMETKETGDTTMTDSETNFEFQPNADTSTESKEDHANNNKINKWGPYKCPFCPKITSNHNYLLIHAAASHLDEKLSIEKSRRQCHKCGKTFMSYANLVGHLVHKHRFLKQTLSQDDLQKLDKESCQIGRKQTTSLDMKKNYKCPFCSKKTSQYNYLLIHAATEHFAEKLSIKNHQRKCPKCDESFVSYANLVSHLLHKHQLLEQTLSEDDLYKLDKESCQLGRKQTISQVNKIKNYKCPFCSKETSQYNYLLVHAATEHFAKKLSIENHQRKCPKCDELFMSYANLVSHLLHKHQILKQTLSEDELQKLEKHSCFLGRKKSNRKKMKKQEDDDAGSNIKKRYKCPFCQKKTSQYNYLLIHAAKAHFSEKLSINKSQRQCPKCEKSFTAYACLVNHFIHKHEFLKQTLSKDDLQKLEKKSCAIRRNQLRSKKLQLKLKKDKMKPVEMKENAADVCTLAKITNSDYETSIESNLEGERSSQPVSSRNDKNYRCPFCPKKTSHYHYLLYHAATTHFANEMLVEKSQRQCHFCGKSYATNRNMISHIVLKHRVLKQLLSDEDFQKLDKTSCAIRKKQPIGKKLRQKNKNQKSCIKAEKEEKEQMSTEQPTFQCPICKCIKSTITHLKVHIGNVHYKKEVGKLVKKNSLGCNLCKRTFNTLQQVESHLLIKHKILSQVLPPDLLKEMDDMNGNCKKRSSFGNESNFDQNEKESYNCHLCERENFGYESFLGHLGKEHFFEELKQDCEQNKCHQGSREVMTETDLVAHLILEHKNLDSFAPEIIVEIKNRKKEQQPDK